VQKPAGPSLILYPLSSIPSGIQDLKDIAQYTRDDPRESPELYDACQRWDAALARHGVDSDEYRRAKGHTDQAGGLIKEELKLHNAQAMVMLSSVSRSCRMWSDAGYPQITIPLGYTMASTPLRQSTIVTRDGQEVDCPWPLYSTYPNMYVPDIVGAFHLLIISYRPFGVTFAGDAFSEAELLGIGYAYEQATQARKQGRTYAEATPQTQIETIQALRM
jgi:amidase